MKENNGMANKDLQAQAIQSFTDFDLNADLHSTGWNTSLSRDSVVCVQADQLSPADPVRVVSVRPARQSKLKVRAFTFPDAPEWCLFSKADSKPQAKKSKQKTTSSETKTTTRIQAPNDTIKLEDRLYYLLQPPLESLLESRSLAMPFRPFPYQLSGISFLYARHAAILADEMGLGKTMQAITTVRLLLHSGELRSVLLVCPKPLLSNWQREFKLWAPEIPVSIIEGNQAKRSWQWNLSDVPVRIANYELLLRDKEEVLNESTNFDLVILDEAQRIKNRLSNSSKVVKAISRTRSWALTGTPIENCADDLVGIFDFLSDGYLSPGMTPHSLRKATRDYIIRRTKDEVLTDMPPKMYRDASINLSPEQADSYQLAENKGVIQLKEMGESITIQHVFELVLRLKQICNFDPATLRSSKLDRLEADLEEVAASGKKAIIFSQWVKSLERLTGHLQRFGPLQYHGKIPHKQRESVIDRFKNDPNSHVILMSYGAGSVGLNLQFCEYVFLFDRWWNPAIEDQAINRAHRIGAAGAVTVTRFVSVGTIEERIDQVLSEKRELFETVLSGAETPKTMGLTQSEIFGLFDLSVPDGKLKVA